MLPVTVPLHELAVVYSVYFLVLFKIRRFIERVSLLFSSVLLLIVVAVAEAKQAARVCRRIDITIACRRGQRFVEEAEVFDQLASRTTNPVLGAPFQGLSTRDIGHTIRAHRFVKEVVAYKNWKGDLRIKILPRRPLARIVYADQHSRYVDEDGTLLPLSDRYTARVLLIESERLPSSNEQKLQDQAHGAALLALLSTIDSDPFWRDQIVYMHINEKGRLVMYMQIGKQYVEFGRLEATEDKLARLALFYKEIAPYKGWNTYRRVNVEFDNQIICE